MPHTISPTSLRQVFVTHLPHILKQFPLPEALQPQRITINQEIDSASKLPSTSTGRTSWWLAERIILHVLEDDIFEQEVVALMRCVREALAADSMMIHAFDVVEQVVDVMSYAFQNVTLKNAFDQDNALPTVYYMLLFVMCCAWDAGGENGDDDDNETAEPAETPPPYIKHIRTYEPTLARIAVVVHKLLLNQEVFAFVRRCGECGCSGPCGTFGYGTNTTDGTRDSRVGRCGWRLFGGCVPGHYD